MGKLVGAVATMPHPTRKVNSTPAIFIVLGRKRCLQVKIQRDLRVEPSDASARGGSDEMQYKLLPKKIKGVA
jgi:hypothetical protein